MSRNEDIEKIVNTYANREEIEENDYNLNIPIRF